MGYDGVELACWGDHFDVDKALSTKRYVQEKWDLLRASGLSCQAVSNHLVGQAVCDLIDERHKSILPPDVWGDGNPEGVRRRAARKMIATAKAARKFFDARPGVPASGRLPCGGQRIHGLVDLALPLRFSAHLAGLLGEGLPGFREPLGADPRGV